MIKAKHFAFLQQISPKYIEKNCLENYLQITNVKLAIVNISACGGVKSLNQIWYNWLPSEFIYSN